MNNYDVIIIGGGLSGLSSAVELLKKDKKILLLEKRKILGGRTSSWMESGMHIESGLHRFLGFFNHLPNLLKECEININEIVTWEDTLEIRMPDNDPSAVFGIAPIFKPVKTLKEAIFNEDFLPLKEKLNLAKFFIKGFSMLKTDPEKLDKLTVEKLAINTHISHTTIDRILVPLTEGLFFLRPERYSAYNFFLIFAPHLSSLYKSRVGAFNGGMTEVMADPLSNFIKKQGAEVKKNIQVLKIINDGRRVEGVKTDKNEFRSENIILATSLNEAKTLLKVSGCEKLFSSMITLRTMPSVTFQIDLKEPAMEKDRTTFSPGTVLSSYAEQSRTTFKSSKGRVSIILATPHRYINEPAESILTAVLKDAKRLKINISKKNVLDYRKVTWAHDFYTYERGSEDLRPSQETDLKGLMLVGDYTKQKYLSTMEGAVYSGILAATLIN